MLAASVVLVLAVVFDYGADVQPTVQVNNENNENNESNDKTLQVLP